MNQPFAKRIQWYAMALVAVLSTTAQVQGADNREVTLKGQFLGPILLELGEEIPNGPYQLKPKTAGETLTAQVLMDNGRRYLAVSAKTPTAAETTYELVATASQDPSIPDVTLKEKYRNVEIQLEGKLFTEYVTDQGAKPFLFPLIGPTGPPFTRAYPMKTVEGEDKDHPHQRSFWFTHGKVNDVDFWSEQGKHGRIRETRKLTLESGRVVAVLRTMDDWYAADGKKVCEDERVLRVFNSALDSGACRVLDYEVTIKATSGPVVFGDTKEGMFGVRVASSMDVAKKTGGQILNAEGIKDDAAWGKASRWVDYTGPVEGKKVGIAILNHPASLRAPTTWHVRTYGLFAANPFGWKDFGQSQSGDYTLPHNERVTFRYRVLLHDDRVNPSEVEQRYRTFAQPPSLVVRSVAAR